MRARDLAEPYPYVSTDDDAVDAARLLAKHKLPALLEVDSDQQVRLVGAITAARLMERLIGGS
ncbi:hypothetical protein HRW23_35265 [Streptomyces lunaelactis]|uniref:CBS domain-containing protein n=1 Tax=Streptomyces lunaelactis TaxID=1535768 RepID=UPI001584E143|nr:CBS domain-containing protein [Streptomyces lunaelactis]NUK74108.1 hypothetical protein [Streptomyces lunaelactis]NUK82516.1 hypothetical protein [Streptomyces lunaelactis]